MTQVVGVLTKFGIDIFTNTIKVAVKYSLFLLLSFFFQLPSTATSLKNAKLDAVQFHNVASCFCCLFIHLFIFVCLSVCLCFFFCFNQIASGSDNEPLSRTGKSFSEVLFLASTNPQYDKRLFIELKVQYMKIPSSEHQENINLKIKIKNNLCTQYVFLMV